MHEVELRSEEFGTEVFRYDSAAEAHAGAQRLVVECQKAFASDGIEREIVLIRRRWTVSSEQEDQ